MFGFVDAYFVLMGVCVLHICFIELYFAGFYELFCCGFTYYGCCVMFVFVICLLLAFNCCRVANCVELETLLDG